MKFRFTLGKKMYFFVTAVVLFATIGVALLSYFINASKMEQFYKRITLDSAKNYATLTDVEYLKKLKTVVLSKEYQELRDLAEESDDEKAVIDYLDEKGLLTQYETEREKLRTYVDNVSDIKYLYIVVWGDHENIYNMYLLDSDDVPVYETGYYEEREKEFLHLNAYDEMEPTISNGSWGWLCSAYAPVYDNEGELICTVGCDLDMEDVMKGRIDFLVSITVTTVILIIFILAGAVIFVHRTVISPLNKLTEGMKRFVPEEGLTYEEAGVIKADLRSNDEIRDIYEETKSMQIRIIDHINSITQIRKEKEMVEDVVKSKEQEIGMISQKAYRDSHTGVGNKAAYLEKTKELDELIKYGTAEFAVVVMDINMLKKVNDTYGHIAGDEYIKGCCQILCETFKHSPVYRIGGDEFVAVPAESDYRERLSKIEEINKKFAETEKDESRDPWLRFSASVGIADYTPDDPDFETVFHRADQMMYENKQAHKKGR
ncbi:MAG: diguanylate cyclase [Clostridia bacterium]|nr:diguanylate cyclase [Clostridia bacterium]